MIILRSYTKDSPKNDAGVESAEYGFVHNNAIRSLKSNGLKIQVSTSLRYG